MNKKAQVFFQLPSGAVHLWKCSFDGNKERIGDYLTLLSQEEVVKSKKFKFEKDREAYIIARGVLRLLLGRYLGIDPKNIQFDYASYGKPQLRQKTSLRFNISHSGNWAVFGFVKDAEIGVDVEKTKKEFDLLDIARNFFSSKEIASLEKQQTSEMHKAFFRCWTRKEAFIKAEGSGLSFPLDAFTVSFDDDLNAKLLDTEWDVSEKEKWSLFSFVPTAGYIGAIATSKDITTVSYYDFDGLLFRSRGE